MVMSFAGSDPSFSGDYHGFWGQRAKESDVGAESRAGDKCVLKKSIGSQQLFCFMVFKILSLC